MYRDYGGYSRKTQKHKTSGRFVIDLKGDDHLYFLMAIMCGCVLCGHKTIADFEAIAATPDQEANGESTVIWQSTDSEGKARTVHRRPTKTATAAYRTLRKGAPT